jgi:hypothetical protein
LVLEYMGGLAASAASVWLLFWAIRRTYEVDEKLDRRAQILRWSIIAAGFAATLPPGSTFKWVRIIGGFLGLAFLCWPNFAYHLRHLGRRNHTLPKMSSGEDQNP